MSEYQLSERLKNVIRGYNLDGEVVEDALAQAVTKSLTWFPAEFEEALRAGAFTPETWGICYGGLHEDDTDVVDRDLRQFWSAIFPDRPYPLDEQE